MYRKPPANNTPQHTLLSSPSPNKSTTVTKNNIWWWNPTMNPTSWRGQNSKLYTYFKMSWFSDLHYSAMPAQKPSPYFSSFSNIKKCQINNLFPPCKLWHFTRFNRSQTWHPRPPATSSRRLSAFGSTERCPHVPATYQAKKRLAKGLLCFTMVYPVYPLN